MAYSQDPYGHQPYGPPPGHPPYQPYGTPPPGPGPQGRFVRLPGPIAGLDARFVQHLIDLAIIVGPFLVVAVLSTALIAIGGSQDIGALAAVGGLLYFLGALGVIGLQVYLQIFDAYKHGGQTYGMRRRGLRVVKADGSPLTQGDLALRWLLLWLVDDGLVGLICIAATQNKQRLGDMAARTLVVHTGP